MRLPNWFRITWWVLLLLGLGIFLANRYPALLAGAASPFDITVFLVWTALVLAPVFSEITLPGIGLKQEITKLREDVKTDVAALRAEITTRLDIRNTFQPQIVIPAPAPDAQLPELEEKVRAAVNQALQQQHIDAPPVRHAEIIAEPSTQFLFATRYNMERELRRIVWSRELAPEGGRRMAPLQLLRAASDAGFIPPELAGAVREVNIICSRAIHAEPVTPAQIAFVRDVAPGIVATLRAIK